MIISALGLSDKPRLSSQRQPPTPRQTEVRRTWLEKSSEAEKVSGNSAREAFRAVGLFDGL
jgi:hypothetical protein